MVIRLTDYYINRTRMIAEFEERKLRNINQPDIDGFRLAIRKNGERFDCFKTGNGNSEFINSKSEEIYSLAEYTVIEQYHNIVINYVHRMSKMSKVLSNERVRLLNSWVNQTIGRIKLLYGDMYKSIIHEIYPVASAEQVIRIYDPETWIRMNERKNTFHQEQLIYRTNKGVLMRTKSEVIWGNHLERRGILYAYEPELVIGNKTFYPDFVLIKPDGSLVIIEHCGLVNNPEYLSKLHTKVDAYRQAGFVQNKNLVLTYESDIRSTDTLDEILLRFYYL